jgi:hypothetical protein
MQPISPQFIPQQAIQMRARPMTDRSEQALAAMLPTPVGNMLGRALPLIKAGVLMVSVAAAIPTANNLYYSYKHGIPFDQVSHRLAQYELWMKNLECKIDYRAISAANNTKIDVGACAKTGDIAIKVSGAQGQAAYEWIALNRLQKPTTQASSLLNLLIGSAQAQTSDRSLKASPPATFQLAQAGSQTGMEVMCEKRDGAKILRIVKDGGKCFRETLSPLKGALDAREEVACTTKC